MSQDSLESFFTDVKKTDTKPKPAAKRTISWSSDDDERKGSPKKGRKALSPVASSSAQSSSNCVEVKVDEKKKKKKVRPHLSLEFLKKKSEHEKSKVMQVIEQPVRKKSERAKLVASLCEDCRGYYATYKHLSEEQLQEKLQQCSRHRGQVHKPPTPDNFWEVDFPSTPELKRRGYLKLRTKKRPESPEGGDGTKD